MGKGKEMDSADVSGRKYVLLESEFKPTKIDWGFLISRILRVNVLLF